ncbi:redoxin domain-containing protein [Pontibacter sp. G13]|uniref:redoxin domain-containing protein n=1 Tax=Pontibacter sp. G13 TaxID=3074898 RepID=UPI00288C0685|nr:thioredoxin-like domain-containing protein [Pontibacter sp. G13]WNJ16625.1 DUF5106 domain-containing protein [Pontibacter sp. G13]
MRNQLTILLCILGMGWMASCSNSTGSTETTGSTVVAAVDNTPADDHYDITLNIPNQTADTAVLAYYMGDNRYVKDTALRVGSEFKFQGDEPLPKGLYLAVFMPGNNFFDFVVGKDQTFTLTTDTTDLAGNMQVDGAADNALFYEHVQYLNSQRVKMEELSKQRQALAEGDAQIQPLEDQMKALNEEVMNTRKELKANNPHSLAVKILTASDAPQVPDAPEGAPEDFQYRYYKAHYWDNLDIANDGLMRTPIMDKKVDEYLDRLVMQHPDSLIGEVDSLLMRSKMNDETFQHYLAYLLNKYADKANKIMGMDAVYLHIVEKYYAAGEAWWMDPDALEDIIEKAEKLSPIIIGRQGKDFGAKDENGQLKTLFGEQAELTILYFWDYDCGRCKKVTPELAKIYPDYKDQGVALYTVSINGDDDTWKKKLKEYGLTGIGATNVADPYRSSGFDDKYNINSTPKIFILDKDKVIRYKWIGVDQLPEILDRELNGETEE